MLESLVAKVINSYVGRYFENINADQLSFGLLQGSVELDDLPLKPSAVNEIDLPIRVIAGSVAKFKLNVPITHLKSSPWNVSIDGLFLVVGPKEAVRGVSAKNDLALKQKALDEIEKTFKESLKSSAAGVSPSSYWFDFSAIVANIVNNLQITVTNIHVRYENFNNLEKLHFSLGFILEKLEVRSTDENWAPAFVASSKIAYKIGNISKLCVYLDHNKTNFEQHGGSIKSYFNRLRETEGFSRGCLLNIIDCGAKYFRNLSTQPLRSKSKPRISLQLTINELPVQVSELQVRSLLYIFNEIERYDRGKFFKKSIPTEPIIGHAKLWWQYAYKCTIQLLSLPTSLDKTLQSIRSIISYVRIYANVLDGIPLSGQEKSQQLEFESCRDFDIIVKLRGIAFDRVKKRRLEAGLLNNEVVDEIDSDRKVHEKGGWFDWWYGKNISTDGSSVRRSSLSESGQEASSTVNEEEFFSIISDAAADCSLRMVDYLYSRIEINLKSGSVSIIEDPKITPQKSEVKETPHKLLQIKFTDLMWNNENYPRFHGVMYNLSLNNLVVLNKTLDLKCPLICKREIPEKYRKGLQALVSPALSPSNSMTASPNEVNFETSKKLFEYNYERFMYRPGAFEHKYRLETQPIDVIYDRSIAKLASKFSKLRLEYSSASRLQKEVYQRYNQIKKQTSSNLKGALNVLLEGSTVKSQDRYNILMNVCAPIIYFYENVNDQNSKIVGVDLGKVTFYNEKGRGDAENPEVVENPANLGDKKSQSEEDLFMTPCSTPRSSDTSNDSPMTVASVKNAITSRDALENRQNIVNLYKRYRLILSDIQVFAGTRSDNWAETFLKSQSSLSLLERFSVRLSLDRSLVSAKMLEEPNVMVQGSVSEIRLRFSQEKIVAVHNCLKQFSKNRPRPPHSDEALPRKSTASSGTIRDLSLFANKVDENKLILLCQFSVSLVSVALHSEDRSLAELQIYSSSIAFKHYPAHTSVKFMIRDVLLVDAIQNYGPEFDLLLASRHDSDDDGPISGFSQTWESPIWESFLSENVPALKRVEMFDAMQSKKGLIEVKITKYHQKHKLNGTACPKFVCSGNFSKIDALANQRTIFELVKYFDKVFAAVKSDSDVLSSNDSDGDMPTRQLAETSSSFTIELDFKADEVNVEFLLAAQESKAKKFAKLSLGSLSVRLETFPNEDVVFKAAMGTFVLDKLDAHSGNSHLGTMNQLPSFRFYMADLSQHESGEPALSVEYVYRTKSWSKKSKVTSNLASVVGLTSLNTDANIDYSLQVNILAAFCIFDAEFFVSLKTCMEELRTYISKIKSSVVSIAKSLASNSKIEENPVVLLVIESPVIICHDPCFETEALVCHLGALYAQSVENEVDMNLANFKLELSALPNVSPAKESDALKSSRVSANDYIAHLMSSTCLLRIANEISILCKMKVPKLSRADAESVFKVDVSVDSEASLSLTKHAVKFMRAVWDSVIKSRNEITDSDLKRETEEYRQSLTQSQRYSLFFPNSKARVRHSMWSAYTKSETEMTVVGIESSSPFSVELRSKCAKFVLLDYQQCEINSCQLEDFRVSMNKFANSVTEVSISHSGLIVTDLFSAPKHKVSTLPKLQQTIFEFKPPPDLSSIAHITLDPEKTPKMTLNFTDIILKLNLQTWVHIFDFFSLGTKAHPSLLSLPNSRSSLADANEPQKGKTFDLSAIFAKIELVLVKPTYNIAKAILEDMELKIGVDPETFRFDLELSNFMVVDESPWNKIHTVRLRTNGDEGKLVASFLKYSCPDPRLEKEFDVSLLLRTGKISFVHTARMLAEINNFFQYLSKMLLMYQFKNADRSGHKMSALKHGARIKLDVEIPEVELILPYAFDNRDCFVGVLKELTIKNDFWLLDKDLSFDKLGKENEESANSDDDHHCLADCLTVKIRELDVSTGRITDPDQKVVTVKSLVDEKFDLEISITRNLDGDNSRLIPDLVINCKIQSIFVSLLESDIQLFKGMLKYNLGENTNDLTWPSDAIYLQSQISSTEKVLTWRKLVLDLKFEDTKFRAFCPVTEKQFAQLSFFNSRLSLVTFSDRTSKFELWSSSFLLEDIRCSGDFPTNQRPFSFTSILKPCDVKKQSIPQLQINFLINSNNKVVSCILSDVELLCNLEWLLMFQQFLLSEPKTVPEQIAVSKCELFATTRLFTSLHHSTTSRTLFGGLGTMVAKPMTLGFGAYQKIAKIDSPTKPTNITKSDEIKVALNDTQIVLLEDVKVLESPAMVVKCSAFLSLNPTSLDKVVKLSVREVELLSCIYHAVKHTKLSIIEPLNIDLEVNCVDQGLAAVPITSNSQKRCQAEVSLSPVVTRLSYQDLVLLLTMVKYYKEVFENATKNYYERNVLANLDKLAFLQDMGYSKELCAEALKKFNGDPNKASVWLIESSLDQSSFEASPGDSELSKITIDNVHFDLDSMSLFLIDDTKSVDLPLLNLNITSCTGSYESRSKEMKVSLKILLNSFNPNLSGWESFVEDWSVSFLLKTEGNTSPKRNVMIESGQMFNLNVTPFSFELVSHLKSIVQAGFSNCRNVLKARQLFLPFVLENNLGLPLNFATSEGSILSTSSTNKSRSLKWRKVESGNTSQFDFSGESGRRNIINCSKDSEKYLHLYVEGYSNISPLSVNEVGTYLRTTLSSNPINRCQERILVEVSFSKQLCKTVITVMSGLEIENCLDIDISARFDLTSNRVTPRSEFKIKPKTKFHVPLSLVYAKLYLKPDLPQCQMYPRRTVEWQNVVIPGSSQNMEVVCTLSDDKLFRYNACIHSKSLIRNPYNIEVAQPSHTIKVCPVLIVQNLLPVSFFVDVSNDRDSGLPPITAEVAKRSSTSIHLLDLSETLQFVVRVEGFRHHYPLIIDSEAVGNGISLLVKLFDTQDRPLSLEANICLTVGGALKIGIYAAYWLVNKTGLPLVFKQLECDWEIPGQSEDNEIATCSTPIMMSFAAGSLRSLKARCGYGRNQSWWRNPRWSSDKIYCDYVKPGHGTISVDQNCDDQTGKSSRSHPSAVEETVSYNLSYEVFEGKDDYANTTFIILRPTYMLYNHTANELVFKQAGIEDSESANRSYPVLPGSCTSFQWASSTVTELMSVKLAADESAVWCGGICISESASFDIYLRTTNNEFPNFIVHVDVVEKNSQCLVYFWDNCLPPQYIIENKCDVDLQIRQYDAPSQFAEQYTSLVPANKSLSYCLDFPLQNARLLCNVTGSSHPATIDLDDETESITLLYETFSIFGFLPVKNDSTPLLKPCLTPDVLVLDVSGTGQVLLQPRSAVRNDQVWRIMPNGMIRNEGRSKPFDYDKVVDGVLIKGSYVLDITMQRKPTSTSLVSSPPGSSMSRKSSGFEMHLMLCVRPADASNRGQLWRIDSEGRLVNQLHAKSVCPVKLASQSHVTLEDLNTKSNNSVWKLAKFQLKPGSGKLTTRMKFQGPTRTLIVEDSHVNALHQKDSSKGCEKRSFISRLEVILSEGISISLMNKTPEELLYVSLLCVCCRYTFATKRTNPKFDMNVVSIQIDNQLHNTFRNQQVMFRTEPSGLETRKPFCLDIVCEMDRKMEFENCKIIQLFSIQFESSVIIIVERLLFKIIQFIEQVLGPQSDAKSWNPLDIINSTAVTPSKSKLFLQDFSVSKFSIYATAQLSRNMSADLVEIKSKYKIILLSFDGAKVTFREFNRKGIMQSSDMFLKDLASHYRKAAENQAMHVIGHVDLLGNPIGLLKDVNTGVRQIDNTADSVSNFARFVTNRMSKNTSRFAESLSDTIGSFIFTEQDQEQRQLFRESYSNGIANNISGGVIGLFKGVSDGVTGVAMQPYRGLRDGGVVGGLTGVVRGVTGVIAKPSIGVLDFAYFAANAMNYTTSVEGAKPERLRCPRCCSYSKLISTYDYNLARSQEFLYQLNGFDLSEKLIALESVFIDPDAMKRMLITNARVLLIQNSSPDENNVTMELPVEKLQSCKVIPRNGISRCVLIIESQISDNYEDLGFEESTQRVDCENSEVAQRLKSLIEYAISKYKKDSFTFK